MFAFVVKVEEQDVRFSKRAKGFEGGFIGA